MPPMFCAGKNGNLSRHYFGIEFKLDDHVYVQLIPPFEFIQCFGLTNDLTYRLFQLEFKFSFDAGIPVRTYVWILDHINEHLEQLWDANCQVFNPSHYALPASLCQSFVNDAIGDWLPNASAWKRGYVDDPEMCLLREMSTMSSKVIKDNLLKVNSNYRGLLCQFLMVIENDMIALCEPLGSGSDCHTKLKIVPPSPRYGLRRKGAQC